MNKKYILTILILFFFFKVQSQIKDDNNDFEQQVVEIKTYSKSEIIKRLESSLEKLNNNEKEILDSLFLICENQKLEEKDRFYAAMTIGKIKDDRATIYSLQNISKSYKMPFIKNRRKKIPFFFNLYNRCSDGEELYLSILKVLNDERPASSLHKYCYLLYAMYGGENSGKEKAEFLLKLELEHAVSDKRRNIIEILKMLKKI